MLRLYIAILIAIIAAPLSLLAQSRNELLANATSLFDSEKYSEVVSLLSPNLSENERDGRANFLLGAAEAMAAQNLSDAVRRLKMAQLRNYARIQSNLFLGRAYQLLCEYEQAHAALSTFLSQSKDEKQIALANTFLSQVESAQRIASKIFSVKTISKTNLPNSQILSAYHASREAGIVSKNSRFFQSNIDPEGLMYMTERADAVYFSITDDEGFERLHKMEKLIDGWSEMSILEGIVPDDANANDRTPFLLTDGTTLYFASDRLGGLGGFDIYRSTYDSETRSFSPPVNIGVPFNSPYDDLLFVVDDEAHKAWFASSRDTHSSDSLTVYEIIWDDSVIRNIAQTTDDIRIAISMPLYVDTLSASSTNAEKVATASIRIKEQFHLQICDSLNYTQWEHFRSPQAARTFRQVVLAQHEKDSLVQNMATQRKEFMSLGSLERNAKLQQLLRTERSIYALEDEIADKTDLARNEEIQEINKLVASGKYTPLATTLHTKTKNIDWSHWLISSNFSVYSDVVFRDARLARDEEIFELFTTGERNAIALQDSLIAWASLIELEAAKMYEAATSGERVSALDEDGHLATLSASDALRRVADYRAAASTLVSEASARKVQVYASRTQALIAKVETQNIYNTAELVELRNKAIRYSNLVKVVDPLRATPDKLREANLMRRRIFSAFDKCLSRYLVHSDGSFPLPSISGIEVDNESPMVQKESAKVEKTTTSETPIESSTNGSDQLTYKIQFGVYKNRPKTSTLDSKRVSSMLIPGRGLTRFYYGNYASRVEAEKDIPIVEAAGFKGAFVVGFDKQGNQIKLD